MDIESTLTIGFALVPLILGIVWRIPKIPFVTFQFIGLMTLGALAGALIFLETGYESEPSTMFLTGALILSGFCVVLGHEKTRHASKVCASTMILLGLALGVVLHPGTTGRLFLCGLLGFLMTTIYHERPRSFRTTVMVLHLIIAFFISLLGVFSGRELPLNASLFLAVTFLPMVPFHLPFTGSLQAAKGKLPSFMVVLWLTVGLSELNNIYSSLSGNTLYFLQLLALISALYASLASLGQSRYNLFLASATVAHTALIWGLLDVFPDYPLWGIPFGTALAFVMGGLYLAFSYIRLRYGWQIIGKLPGLATPMPRFGAMMFLLVGLALILPLFPAISGLMNMPGTNIPDFTIARISVLLMVIWLGGSWYFSNMMHKTAFGETRTDVPYTDLRFTEILAITVLLLGATYCGMIH